MESGFHEIFTENYGAVFGFVFRMTGDRDESEDIVQEAFLRLIRQKREDKAPEYVRRWLFVVARNLCMSRFRRRVVRAEYPLLEERISASNSHDPAEHALSRERREIVKSAVLSLPHDLREVIILREFEDMTYAEIAAITGCPSGTVRSRIARARDELCKILMPILEV